MGTMNHALQPNVILQTLAQPWAVGAAFHGRLTMQISL